jgi:hypothetical protein
MKQKRYRIETVGTRYKSSFRHSLDSALASYWNLDDSLQSVTWYYCDGEAWVVSLGDDGGHAGNIIVLDSCLGGVR